MSRYCVKKKDKMIFFVILLKLLKTRFVLYTYIYNHTEIIFFHMFTFNIYIFIYFELSYFLNTHILEFVLYSMSWNFHSPRYNVITIGILYTTVTENPNMFFLFLCVKTVNTRNPKKNCNFLAQNVGDNYFCLKRT